MFFLWISKQKIQVPVGPDKEPVASADHHLNLQVDPPPVEPSDETQLQPATVTLWEIPKLCTQLRCARTPNSQKPWDKGVLLHF